MPFGAQRWRNEADDGGVEAVDGDDEAEKGNQELVTWKNAVYRSIAAR
jgi:hypothetical protein